MIIDTNELHELILANSVMGKNTEEFEKSLAIVENVWIKLQEANLIQIESEKHEF